MLGDKKQKTKELFSFSKRKIIWTKYVCNCPFCSSRKTSCHYFVGLHVCKFAQYSWFKSNPQLGEPKLILALEIQVKTQMDFWHFLFLVFFVYIPEQLSLFCQMANSRCRLRLTYNKKVSSWGINGPFVWIWKEVNGVKEMKKLGKETKKASEINFIGWECFNVIKLASLT